MQAGLTEVSEAARGWLARARAVASMFEDPLPVGVDLEDLPLDWVATVLDEREQVLAAGVRAAPLAESPSGDLILHLTWEGGEGVAWLWRDDQPEWVAVDPEAFVRWMLTGTREVIVDEGTEHEEAELEAAMQAHPGLFDGDSDAIQATAKRVLPPVRTIVDDRRFDADGRTVPAL